MSKRIDVHKEVSQAELDIESTQNKLKNIDSQEDSKDEVFYENQLKLRTEKKHESEIQLVETVLGEEFQTKLEKRDEQLDNLTELVLNLTKMIDIKNSTLR